MLNYLNIHKHKEKKKEIKALYERSFPDDEKVPFFMLYNKSKTEISKMYGIYEHDVFIGMLTLLQYQDILFLWYLSIDEKQRNQGYGSKILQDVIAQNEYKRIILNIEEITSISTQEQVRRKQFYIKNGFSECGFKTEEFGVVYEMLCYKKQVSYEEYAQMMIAYCGKKVFDKIYKQV